MSARLLLAAVVAVGFLLGAALATDSDLFFMQKTAQLDMGRMGGMGADSMATGTSMAPALVYASCQAAMLIVLGALKRRAIINFDRILA